MKINIDQKVLGMENQINLVQGGEK